MTETTRISPRKPRKSSGWSDERRARQRAAIRRWKPWTKSTGPKTAYGKAAIRYNALKHGNFIAGERANDALAGQIFALTRQMFVEIETFIEKRKILAKRTIEKRRRRAVASWARRMRYKALKHAQGAYGGESGDG